jgi:hypothetical protein
MKPEKSERSELTKLYEHFRSRAIWENSVEDKQGGLALSVFR